YTAGGIARGLTVGLAVMAVAFLFSEVRFEHPWVALGIAVLTCILFSLGGLINAIYANSFDDISIIPNFVLTPLTYLGGVFYSVSILPPIWQKVSLFNPVLYMIDGFRFAMLGKSDIALATSFAIVLLFIAVLYGWCHVLLVRGTGLRS
ncbi:MAG TPA: ABC transporter permease, partial [Chromatiales bacterium]|nr:ABC transporter permease [Chromatiales bacterium]